MTNLANQGEYVPNASTAILRVRDLARMNTLEFRKYKMEKNAQEFMDEVNKVLSIMGMKIGVLYFGESSKMCS